MQFTSFVLIALSAISSAYAGTLAAQDKAGARCSGFSISGSTVSARCFNTAGTQQVQTSINLNQCTVNNNGVIACQKNGQAGTSCNFSNIADNNGFLTITASCLNTAGGSRITTNGFPLDQCLTNSNGQLTC